MASERGEKNSLLKQPGAVWAVAFACVISFMGIGLVDPILPALADSLEATPAQVSLLFTSYLVVTAIAMLGVGWVSSRIGSKRTLVVGLIVIVIFSALAGLSANITQIVLFRGGWGLGNALFIATSLAVIVASAKGGFSGAIILYEAALGVGIAVGPLLGGELGSISWRGPFFGVAALMAIALIATLVFVKPTPRPAEKISLGAPLKALKHRGLRTMGLMALLYNWGFFTMLGYAPYPMELGAHELGLVFTGWGILVALFAVFFAPRLQRRFGTAAVLYANLAGLAIVMAVIAIGVNTPVVVMVAVIASGAFIGINNTLTTQAVMMVSPVERSVASSAYGFVRFIGGGLAPFVAGKIAEATDQSVAFWVGAAAFVVAIPVLASGHGFIRRAEQAQAEDDDAHAMRLAPVGEALGAEERPVVAAIDNSSAADAVVDRAVDVARQSDAAVDIVHVYETTVLDEDATSIETEEQARATVSRQVGRVAAHGVAVSGHVLASIGDHAAVGARLAAHADAAGARSVVVGSSRRATLERMLGGSAVTALLTSGGAREVIVVDGAAPEAPGGA